MKLKRSSSKLSNSISSASIGIEYMNKRIAPSEVSTRLKAYLKEMLF